MKPPGRGTDGIVCLTSLDALPKETVTVNPPSGPTTLTIGFLTILEEGNGVQGGYLVTNAWGRPVEFRMSTAVQPNRVQQILYAHTLRPYLCAELIGKTLIEKSSTPIQLLVANDPAVVPLRHHLALPILVLQSSEVALDPHHWIQVPHAPTAGQLTYAAECGSDGSTIAELLSLLDSGLDLSEPFSRIREAMTEARKVGVSNRVAA